MRTLQSIHARRVVRATLSYNRQDPRPYGGFHAAPRVPGSYARRARRAPPLPKRLPTNCPNNCRRVAPRTEHWPEFGQDCPISATCWPSWANFGKKTVDWGDVVWSNWFKIRPKLANFARFRPDLAQEVGKSWPKLGPRSWSTLADCWPMLAQIGQVPSLFYRIWPNRPNRPKCGRNWASMAEFGPILGSREICSTILGQQFGNCRITSEFARIAGGNFRRATCSQLSHHVVFLATLSLIITCGTLRSEKAKCGPIIANNLPDLAQFDRSWLT